MEDSFASLQAVLVGNWGLREGFFEEKLGALNQIKTLKKKSIEQTRIHTLKKNPQRKPEFKVMFNLGHWNSTS